MCPLLVTWIILFSFCFYFYHWVSLHFTISPMLGAFGGWHQVHWRQCCCKSFSKWQCQKCNQNTCPRCWFIWSKVFVFHISLYYLDCHSFTKQFILNRLWHEADGSSHSSGLSCPPENFVEDPFLMKAKEFLSEGGLFIINLVSRSSSVREMVVSRLKAVRCVMALCFSLHTSYCTHSH